VLLDTNEILGDSEQNIYVEEEKRLHVSAKSSWPPAGLITGV
jgi:hypothetical protein